MSDEIEGDAAGAGGAVDSGVGAQLRAAREARGLSLAQVAAQTRIGVGSLELIEAGQFQRLPGRIYATGFAKTYAKLVGLDQNDVAEMVRFELGADPAVRALGSDFVPGDPTRAPSGRLVWFSVAAMAVLIAGLYFASRVLMDPAAELPSLTEQQEAEQAAAEAASAAATAQADQPIDAGGEVVLTAEEAVWLRLTDAQNRRLMEGELAAGQTYAIPAAAVGPKLITGRPNALAITVGGRPVPKISEELRTVVDVPVDAASLLARTAPPVAATPAPTFTPSTGTGPSPTPSPRSSATVD